MAISFEVPDDLHPSEVQTHQYRVGFWSYRQPDPGWDTPDYQGWGVEIWDLVAQDVHEVIEWADDKAGSELIYTLYVRLRDRQNPGLDTLVHIAGADPTRNPQFDDGFFRQHPLR